jgi:hypothetical protein
MCDHDGPGWDDIALIGALSESLADEERERERIRREMEAEQEEDEKGDENL